MNKTTQNFADVVAAMDSMRRSMTSARERLGEGLQLTRTQIEILLLLGKAPHNTGDLAKRLFLSQSAITQTVETLVRRGLIERHQSEHDRRIIQLELTAAGRQLDERIGALRSDFMKRFAAQLSPQETASWISITRKLTELLEETNNTSKSVKDLEVEHVIVS